LFGNLYGVGITSTHAKAFKLNDAVFFRNIGIFKMTHDEDEDIMTGDEIAVKRLKEKIKSLESKVSDLRNCLERVILCENCSQCVNEAKQALTTHPAKEEK
jgi:hypothetical protein